MSCHGTVPSSLGFKAVKCCATPCPNFPLHHVRICFRVNSTTQIQIQQGCQVYQGSTPTCNVDYRAGVSEDSWGRKCRVVYWDRFVPSDSFVRILVCPAGNGCVGTSCGQDLNGRGQRIKNQLINFEVDGVKLYNVLQAILTNSEGEYQCIKVGCVNAEGTADCCHAADGSSVFTQLSDIPWSSQIVVGPIGQEISPVLAA